MATHTNKFNSESIPSNSIPTAITKATAPTKAQVKKSAVTVASAKTAGTTKPALPPRPGTRSVINQQAMATPATKIELPPEIEKLEKLEALWNSFNLIIEAIDFYQGFTNQTEIARQLWASKINDLTSDEQSEVQQLLGALDGLNQTMRSLSGLGELKAKFTDWILKAGRESGSSIRIELVDAQGKQQVVSIMDAKQKLNELIRKKNPLPAMKVELTKPDGTTETVNIEGVCNQLEEVMAKPVAKELFQQFAKKDLFKNALSHIAAISAWHKNNSEIAQKLNALDKPEPAPQQESSVWTKLKNSVGWEDDDSKGFKVVDAPRSTSDTLTRDIYSGKLNGFGAKFKLIFEGISKNFAAAGFQQQLTTAQHIATTVDKLVGEVCNQFTGLLPKKASQSIATYQILAEADNQQQTECVAVLELTKTTINQLSQSKRTTKEIRDEYSKLAGKLLDANVQYPSLYSTWQELLNALAATGNEREKEFMQESIAPQLVNQNITDENTKAILYDAQFLIVDLEADNNERRRQTKLHSSNLSLQKTEEARMEKFAKAVEALAKVRHAPEAKEEAERLMKYLDRLPASDFEKHYLQALKALNVFFDFSAKSEKEIWEQQNQQLTQHLQRVNALKMLLPDNIEPTNQILAQLLANEALGKKEFLTTCMDIKYQQVVNNSSKNFNFTPRQIEVLSLLAAEGHYQSLNALGNYYLKQKHDPASASLFFELAYYQANNEQRETILTQLKQTGQAAGTRSNKQWEAKLQTAQLQAPPMQQAEASQANNEQWETILTQLKQVSQAAGTLNKQWEIELLIVQLQALPMQQAEVSQANNEQWKTILTQLKQASQVASTRNKQWEIKLLIAQLQAPLGQRAEVSLIKAEALIVGLETVVKRPLFEFFGVKKQPAAGTVIRPQISEALNLLQKMANLPKYKQQCLNLIARLEKTANNVSEKACVASAKDSMAQSSLQQQQNDRAPVAPAA